MRVFRIDSISLRDSASNQTSRNGSALQCSLKGFGDFGRRDPLAGAGFAVYLHLNLRHPNLWLDLQVHDARYLRHGHGDVVGRVAQLIQVGTKDLHGDLSPNSRHNVVQPVRNRLADVENDAWDFRKCVANVGKHFRSWAPLFLAA
jgi:hypothetical protein